MLRSKLSRRALAVTASAVMAGALLSAALASPAAADYGKGAVRQVEISANSGGHDGGGVWLWIALDSNGTGDYTGSDCGHGFGAVADKGDVTWSSDGTTITIQGVVLNGLGGLPVTITVPWTVGHYMYNSTLPVLGVPFNANTQVQVAGNQIKNP